MDRHLCFTKWLKCLRCQVRYEIWCTCDGNSTGKKTVIRLQESTALGIKNDVWPFDRSLNPCQNEVEVCIRGNQSVDVLVRLSQLAGVGCFTFFVEGNDLPARLVRNLSNQLEFFCIGGKGWLRCMRDVSSVWSFPENVYSSSMRSKRNMGWQWASC